MANRPYCIDIYKGDDVSDTPTPLAGLDQVKAYGIPFCIHKASEGTSYQDPRYMSRRAKWMQPGKVKAVDLDGTLLSLDPKWGAYHFFHGQNPVAEAKNFLAAASLQVGDQAFVDWEAVGASGYYPRVTAVDAFCKEVEDATGRSCGVYGGNVPREQLSRANIPSSLIESFSKRPFWFCSYGPIPAKLPLPWKDSGIWLWQDDGDAYGPGPHKIPGITALCDNSTIVAPMTLARLYAEWGT